MRLLGTAAAAGSSCSCSRSSSRRCSIAEGLRKQAQIQPQGFERRLALAATRPLVRASRTLHLTSPRHELQVAIGRAGEDRIDPGVHLALPPPARPSPRPSPSPPAAADAPAKPLFTAARPLRVWVAGDSLAQVPGDALERLGGAVDVVGVESRLATGLARPDLYNWYTRFNQLLAGRRPQVAVLSFGADDAHDFLAGVPGGRQVGPLGPRRGRRSTRAGSRGSRASSTPPASGPSGSACRSRTARASDTASRSSTRSSPRSRNGTRADRRTSTRGTCSTARAARTRRTCECTGH